MLIPLQTLINKYHLKFKGVIHVGAHYGEEVPEYDKAGIKDIVLIEPCKQAFEKLIELWDSHPFTIIMQNACGAESKNVLMNTASFNKGESNSVLRPQLHLHQHPEVVFDGHEVVEMDLLDNLIGSDAGLSNFLAMDCQGYEGEVLKGAIETLKYIDYIYTEVNRGQTYEGNMEIEGIDELLHEFKRVETKWASQSLTWGDAFYIRKSLIK